MPARAAIIGHGVDYVSVKVWAANLPPPAFGRRAQYKCALRRTDQQQNVAAPNIDVGDAAMDRDLGPSLIRRELSGENRGRLDRLDRRLNLAGLLVALGRFFGEAALDNRRKAGRHAGRERRRQLGEDGGTGFETGVSSKGQLTGS